MSEVLTLQNECKNPLNLQESNLNKLYRINTLSSSSSCENEHNNQLHKSSINSNQFDAFMAQEVRNDTTLFNVDAFNHYGFDDQYILSSFSKESGESITTTGSANISETQLVTSCNETESRKDDHQFDSSVLIDNDDENPTKKIRVESPYLIDLSRPPQTDYMNLLVEDEIQSRKSKKAMQLSIKKPRSAYILFLEQSRGPYLELNPSASFNEYQKYAGALWRNMSPEEKQQFHIMEMQEKKRFQKEFARLQQALGYSDQMSNDNDDSCHDSVEEDPPLIPGHKQIKYPKTAFSIFVNVMRPTLLSMNPELIYNQVQTSLFKEWKSMNKSDKQVWLQLEAEYKKKNQQENIEDSKKPRVYSKKSFLLPRSARSAYTLFFQAARKQLSESNPSLSFKQFPTVCSKLWKEMAPDQRALWQEDARQDLHRYQAELRQLLNDQAEANNQFGSNLSSCSAVNNSKSDTPQKAKPRSRTNKSQEKKSIKVNSKDTPFQNEVYPDVLFKGQQPQNVMSIPQLYIPEHMIQASNSHFLYPQYFQNHPQNMFSNGNHSNSINTQDLNLNQSHIGSELYRSNMNEALFQAPSDQGGGFHQHSTQVFPNSDHDSTFYDNLYMNNDHPSSANHEFNSSLHSTDFYPHYPSNPYDQTSEFIDLSELLLHPLGNENSNNSQIINSINNGHSTNGND